MCPMYILSRQWHRIQEPGNGSSSSATEHSITSFPAPYHPQSNGKLEVFYKYLKPTLKKLRDKDPANWDKYINQVLASYRVTPNLATA